ncbi:DUF6809 family protein [Harryflintia acetispora]|uniref:Uncharacterized protein n=1 Tax=Harryflintia acetispora TaxID=1849041 RepID=A0A9X8Y7L6_9FIRM|nr:DUF6809 family protein [Harryflintia acetispora]TCL42478.1 hypothetical protein EDD78_110104 [Harryflintia acetispora]
MGEVLLNLYYGKHPLSLWKKEDKQYLAMEEEIERRELFLSENLPYEWENDMFHYLNACQQRNDYVEELIFKKAFSLGLRVMAEAFSATPREAPEEED